MPTDRAVLVRVACVAFVSCGPAVKPDTPRPEPDGVVKDGLRHPSRTGGSRHVVVGEMCPEGAAGRHGIAPIAMRTVGWGDAAAELTTVVERGSVPQFEVLGHEGRPAGLFHTMGVTTLGLPQAVAVGTYTGSEPCATVDKSGEARVDPTCKTALSGCGLAVATISQGSTGEDPERVSYPIGGACVGGDAIVIDVDGDGATESFPLASLLDGVRSPAQEWSATPSAGAPCAATFQLYGVKLVAPPEAGKPSDPKATVILDVLGVLDLDGDARREVVLGLRFPTVRTVAIYAAPASPQRLELVGENESFAR